MDNDKTNPVSVRFTTGKPNKDGYYLCIHAGNAHPEFARIRTYDGVLTYIGAFVIVPLEEIGDNALFSEPISLEFA